MMTTKRIIKRQQQQQQQQQEKEKKKVKKRVSLLHPAVKARLVFHPTCAENGNWLAKLRCEQAGMITYTTR